MSLQHEDVPESTTSLGSGLLPTNHKDGEEDDDDDEDDEDEDDDDEDDDDVEPMLKYQRLSANLADALKKDAVAAMAVSDRFLALGTHWGVVHILDLAGNNVKRFACHSATVNDLAIDDSGEFVASASDDGRVIINSLYTPEVFQFKHKRPVKCVSLEPEYSRKQSRMHVSGGSAETLLLTGKGWFSSFDTVIGSGEGAIWAVEWRTNYIAWANDAGVKVYDCVSSQTFGSIERPANSPRSDLYRCNICWKDNTTLMVGWADSVKICVVKDRAGKKATDTTRSLSPPSSNLNLNLPTKYVEIVCEFRTEFIISGIAPLRDQIVLLAFITDTGDRQNIDILPTPENNVAEKLISEPPEVHVVDMNGDQVANDVLSLFGFEHYRANDYRLAFLPSSTTIADTTFYIVSPKDIVVAKPRDLDDHIEFLVSKARYEEALAAAERATVNKREVDGSLYQGRMRVEDVVSIGIKYLTSLMQDGDYEQAAAMTPKILRTDPKLWEQWIYSFMGIDKLAVLLPFIPFSQLQLNKAVYEMILSRFLETDERTFLDLIQQWPSNWYSAATVADGVEVKLAKDESNSVLLDAAVKLCTTAMRFEKALVYGLRRRKPNILDLVEPHNLFQALQANVVLLLEYDFDNAIADEDIVGSRDWTGVEEGYGSRPGEYIEERVRIIRRAGLQNGVALLVAHTDRAPPAMIVKTFLQSVTPSSKKLLHIYLDALFRNDSLHDLSMPVHTMQVELYAEFDPTRLIDFLRSPEVTYDVQRAFALCEIRDLVPEMVFLLGKMGDNRRALKLLIERVGNVQQAIDFAKEQNDNLLWDDLIKFSMNKPAFIAGLLENLGSHIDPVKLIRSIPEGLPIPNLRKCLIKIMTDYGIQMSLREGCGKIIVSDTVKLMEGLYNIQRRAVIFSGGLFQIVLPALINVSKDKDLLCSVCENKLSFEDQDQHIVLYFCRHMYHNSCLLSAKSLLQSNNSRTGVSAESLVNAEERDDHVNKENQHVIDSIYDSSAGTDAEARLRGGSLNLMAQYGLDGGLWDDMGNLRDTRPSAGEDGGPLQELSSLRCSDSSGVRSGVDVLCPMCWM